MNTTDSELEVYLAGIDRLQTEVIAKLHDELQLLTDRLRQKQVTMRLTKDAKNPTR